MSEAKLKERLRRAFEDVLSNTEFGVYSNSELDHTRPDLLIVDDKDAPVAIIELKRSARQSFDNLLKTKSIQNLFKSVKEFDVPYLAVYNGERGMLWRQIQSETGQSLDRLNDYNLPPEEFSRNLISDLESYRIKTDNILDVGLVESFRRAHDEFQVLIEQELNTQPEAELNFNEWAERHGYSNWRNVIYDQSGEGLRRFASFAAFSFLNRILFLAILNTSSAHSKTVPAIKSGGSLDDSIALCDEAAEESGFETIFGRDIYLEVVSSVAEDSSPGVQDALEDFLYSLHSANIGQLSSDELLNLYEMILPAEQRKAVGDYYTPKTYCDILAELTIEQEDAQVLDPACGTGGLLTSAYNQKRELAGRTRGGNQKRLDEVFGIDIDSFPAQSAGFSLLLQEIDSYANRVNILARDFFEVSPESKSEKSRFGSYEFDFSGNFDAVLSHPPNIRHEGLKDRTSLRKHLGEINASYISKRSDAYVYFVTHATQFLAEGGRLGLVLPTNWLSAHSGRDFRRFLKERFVIDSIIGFQNPDMYQIDNQCLLSLRKCQDKAERDSNIVRFVPVGSTVSDTEAANVVEAVEADYRGTWNEIQARDFEQARLNPDDNWSPYLTAPEIYFNLVENGSFTTVDEIADVQRGVVSGANDFFYFSGQEVREHNLEEYARPAVRSPTNLESPILEDESGFDTWILDIHEHVQRAVSESNGPRTEEDVKQWLQEYGHQSVVDYINQGEDQEIHERSTCAKRPIWFDLALEQEGPPVLVPRALTQNTEAILNRINATASSRFHLAYLRSEYNSSALAGVLNSAPVQLILAVEGQSSNRRGMVEIQTNTLKALKIPKLNRIGSESRKAISEQFEALADSPLNIELQLALDEAVLNALDIEEDPGEVRRALDALL